MIAPRVDEVDGRRILFTNLEAPVWVDEGITKGDLLAYYLDVADPLMPFLVNRPLSLLRGPDDAGECVYQRTAPPGLPPWIPVRRVRAEHAALGYTEHVIGTERAEIAYLVNLGYLSFHPWGSTLDTIDRPTVSAVTALRRSLRLGSK